MKREESGGEGRGGGEEEEGEEREDKRVEGGGWGELLPHLLTESKEASCQEPAPGLLWYEVLVPDL